MNTRRKFVAVAMVWAWAGSAVVAAEEPRKPPAAVEEGIIPKSIQIPGTTVSLTFGGYVKLDVIQDLDSVGNAYEFKTSTIALDGTAAADQGGQTTLSVRETRFNLGVVTGSEPGSFRVFFEGDFFGDNGSFRIRHAYGEYKRILAGQTWSTFMDVSARPLTVDFEGPDAEVFIRNPMIRYKMPIGDRWTWSIAVEQPASQITDLAGFAGSARSDAPDLTTNFRFEKPRGHVQLSAVGRRLRWDGTGGSPDVSTTGWGVSGTFGVKAGTSNEIVGQAAYGEGIARYVDAISGTGTGLNLDAVITPTGDMDAIEVAAGVLGLTHHWSKTLKSGVAFALAETDPDPLMPATSVTSTRDARLNLIWTPYKLLDYGVEVLYGRLETLAAGDGDAWRVQVAATYRFN